MDKTNLFMVERAQLIVDQLKQIFDDLSDYRWIMTGSGSLVYVTGDSREFRLFSYLVDGQIDSYRLAIRTSDDRVGKLVFGLKDDLKYNEVFWPQAL